ncbi:hypothetical protein AGNV_135 [Anticarsia gemmatalis multiple nucleopolyhedrovirus]|uniref:Uncharacterized protein n=1 Tax=Anticarsia gemmatalis multiple nucleopolyhedrovirus TaxID=268591 RepID=A0A0S3J007_9ABAC|nr:hypothetical protein AGNV_135 [Anticarsia gemmatalis nucleopolyhedrovirus]YP_009316150.1 hypothetical protein AGNV_135 [Anticarsia gemmatalis multiple nucleopolyhedrovirus]AKJ32601.1 hypothetical protein AGNV_135 [Anticarsia gemmatalis multiple nucleopolyhedrovirus]ALR69940.1 hypothetical protein AGNV_135 [Anticarsia gemmatalis multiple nucleopolyhedrovirus]ALR70098.1 hypothetical protein AGNV_135 [Anticarsia gemmatalis multiple nucleopolyhedrovirus]ALR70255.1 hypothetical protein AGNV_135 
MQEMALRNKIVRRAGCLKRLTRCNTVSKLYGSRVPLTTPSVCTAK